MTTLHLRRRNWTHTKIGATIATIRTCKTPLGHDFTLMEQDPRGLGSSPVTGRNAAADADIVCGCEEEVGSQIPALTNDMDIIAERCTNYLKVPTSYAPRDAVHKLRKLEK